MTTESKAGEALDLNKSRAEFEAWARSKGSANFMRMSGDPEAYDDLILRAQFKAWCAALARRSLPVDGDLLNAEELAALRRFDECAQDGEGYDVPKEMMQRLAEIGVVRRRSGAYYEHTEFGLALLEGRAALALARAGSAAPAAPTFWKSQSKMIERAIIGLRDGWATRKDADDALAILAAPTAAERPSDPVVEANRKLLLDRSRVGINKYGVTLAASGLSRAQLAQHALEEALDLANYLQTIIQTDASIAAQPKDTTDTGRDA